MAEVNVDKTRNEDSSRQGSQGMSRRGSSYPSALWRNPSEMLSMNPFSLMRRFSEEMDRAFSDWPRFGGEGNVGWSPAIEVSEREGKLMIHADLPGLNKDDVKIEVADDHLILQGERKREHSEQGKGFQRSERSYGTFYRSIPLPDGADLDQTRAQFNNGVLEVTIPVPEQQPRRRQIPVEAGTERNGVTSENATHNAEFTTTNR